MKYTVVWLPDAMDRLADIWNQATDRRAVSHAANRIDQRLRIDPDRQGQVFGANRTLFEAPLVVTFAVQPDDRLVEVLEVDRIQP